LIFMAIHPKNSTNPAEKLVSEKNRLRFMGGSFLIAWTLGAYGYFHYPFGDETVSFSNALYHSAQLFILHAPHFEKPVPWTLEMARWLAPISTGLVLLDATIRLFYHEQKAFKMKKMNSHSIVCGLGRKGMAVVEKLHKSGSSVVVVEKNPDPEMEDRLLQMGILMVLGDATRIDVLKDAKLDSASALYALCPEDSTNCAIAMEANKISSTNGKTRKCFIHINDAELRSALQQQHQSVSSDTNQTLRFIDAFGPQAISLLAYGFPLDHDGIAPDDTRSVHLVILGFGRMGRTVAIKAAQLGQFANGKPLQISVIDNPINLSESALLFHHPSIGDVTDFLLYQHEILSPQTRELIKKWCNEPNRIVNIAICIDNQSVAYSLVFNLLPVFNRENVRVAIRVQDAESFNFLLEGARSKKYHDLRIHPFGIEKGYENLTDPEHDIPEKFAMDIHQAFVKLVCEQLRGKDNELEKREKSVELKEWNSLREDFRESSRQQAIHMYFKTRAAGCEIVDKSDERPAIEQFEGQQAKQGIFRDLAIMEHNRWVAERKVNNWKYGKKSDKENRISEYLVDWNQLPEDIKQYDYDAVARIPVLLNSVGKKMVAKKNKN
jgi:hypothetical protein